MVFNQEKKPKEYEVSYQTKYRRVDTLEKKLLKKLLFTQVSPMGRVLEVGCGTAHFTQWMETLGLESYGVDTSEVMLKEANKRWIPSRLIKCNATHLPFTAKSFDVVSFITSLEFMPDPEVALMEAVRVARKGVVIGLLNKYSLSTLSKKLRMAIGRSRYYAEAHFYSLGDIKRMLKKRGIQCKTLKWSTTLFPKVFGETESSIFPFGGFLGIAIELRNRNV